MKYTLVETTSGVTVKFGKNGDMRDVPSKTFSKSQYKSIKQARKAAEQYAEGQIDLKIQTSNLAFARTVFPALNYKKVSVQATRSNNKTASVGVYLQYRYDAYGRKIPGAYISCYSVNGKRKSKYFSIVKLGQEEAHRRAIQHRLLTINTHIDLL